MSNERYSSICWLIRYFCIILTPTVSEKVRHVKVWEQISLLLFHLTCGVSYKKSHCNSQCVKHNYVHFKMSSILSLFLGGGCRGYLGVLDMCDQVVWVGWICVIRLFRWAGYV
jgi:hypothetical protein